MRRRRLLGVAGAGLGALCGCLDRIAGGDGEGDPTDTGTDAAGVRILDSTATPEVITMGDDSIGVAGGRAEQCLIVTIGTDDDVAPAVEEFAIETGSESYRPSEDLSLPTRSLWEFERPYDPERRDAGWIGFVLPKPVPVEGESATLTWPGGEHALDDAIVAELARPPTDFAVREFAAPATVENPGTVSLSLTVENVGQGAGTFVGALNRVGPRIAYAPEATIRLDIDSGETAVWEHEYRVSTTGDDAEVRFHLHWRDGSETREVDIEPE